MWTYQYTNLKMKKVEVGDLVNVFLERTDDEPRTHLAAKIVEVDWKMYAQTDEWVAYWFDHPGIRWIGLAQDNRIWSEMTEEEKEDVRNSHLGRRIQD